MISNPAAMSSPMADPIENFLVIQISPLFDYRTQRLRDKKKNGG